MSRTGLTAQSNRSDRSTLSLSFGYWRIRAKEVVSASTTGASEVPPASPVAEDEELVDYEASVVEAETTSLALMRQ